MKQAILAILSTLALLVSSGVARAQSASISPNNIHNGDFITVTVVGLVPNKTYTMIVAGVSENGTVANDKIEVQTDANGTASWTEDINWGADTYSTNVSVREGTGQPANYAAGTLHVA